MWSLKLPEVRTEKHTKHTIYSSLLLSIESKDHYSETYINGVIGGGWSLFRHSLSTAYTITGTIPSRHHATVLEGRGGESETLFHPLSLFLTLCCLFSLQSLQDLLPSLLSS